MNPTTRIKHTPEQMAEWHAIHEYHKQHPILEVPKTAIKGRSFMAILKLLGGLKAARETQGLPLEEVATRMGIEPVALTRLETGKELDPSIFTLLKWAEVLGQKLTLDLAKDA